MKKYRSEYKVKKLYQDTYSISDNGFGQGSVYMYLLIGSQRALLIDSGYGLLDLKQITRSITDKPVICACSHGHIDHALGASQFEESYLHSLDFALYEKHSDAKFIHSMGMQGLLMKPSAGMLNNPSYLELVENVAKVPHSPLLAMDDIAQFDLGDRIITTRRTPGHTQGSIVFVDRKNAVAFDSDCCALGAWIFLAESSPLPEYIEQLEQYITYLKENGVTKRYVGHSSAVLTVQGIEKLRHCAQYALEHPNKGIKIDSTLGHTRIVLAAGSLLFCGREDAETVS